MNTFIARGRAGRSTPLKTISITPNLNPDILQPGDCLLYSPHGFFGQLIAIKTWHKIAHVEVYIGEGYSIASRDGIGVDSYHLRTDQLAWVLRPSQEFDFISALQWFLAAGVRGQKYDMLGLLRFVWWGSIGNQTQTPHRQFCSEFAARFYAAGGFRPFGMEDADAIAPFQFFTTSAFTPVWGATVNIQAAIAHKTGPNQTPFEYLPGAIDVAKGSK